MALAHHLKLCIGQRQIRILLAFFNRDISNRQNFHGFSLCMFIDCLFYALLVVHLIHLSFRVVSLHLKPYRVEYLS